MNIFTQLLLSTLLIVSSHAFGAHGAGAGATVATVAADTLIGDEYYRFTALMEAANRGDVATVQRLIATLTRELHVASVNRQDIVGFTPLILASYKGSCAIITALLAPLTPDEQIAAITHINNNGIGARVSAQRSGKHAALRLLTDYLTAARAAVAAREAADAAIDAAIDAARDAAFSRRSPAVRAWAAARYRGPAEPHTAAITAPAGDSGSAGASAH